MKKFLLLFCGLLSAIAASAQSTNADSARFEVGLNFSKGVALLLGADPRMQPLSVHLKMKQNDHWWRVSLRHERYPDFYNFDRFLRDSLLVQHSIANNSWAAATSVGLERRRTLGRGWQFTYGADALFRHERSLWWRNETRFVDFETNNDAFFGPSYSPTSANFTSEELERNETRSNQYGINMSAGMWYHINQQLGLHMQINLSGWLSQNNFKNRNYVTNEASDGTNWTWETQRLPGFSEIALYYRF